MVTRGEKALHFIITSANEFRATIKFTAEYSKKEINLLDTMVKKDEKGHLYTDLYVKPTDKSNYLHFSSRHPPHCKRIP